mgnify:CR=1 FL=1
MRYDSFGTQRYSVDVNQPLGARVGFRFNALNSEVEQFRQRGSKDYRGFALAARVDDVERDLVPALAARALRRDRTA